MRIGADLETAIWVVASQAYGPSLKSTIAQALSRYRRSPGHDDMTRLYSGPIGPEAFEALGLALAQAMPNRGPDQIGYLEIRSRLRWHLASHLQRCLINDGYATSAMREDLFGTELGL